MTNNRNGFALMSEKTCPDAGGTLREYVHEKTGARVYWMDNGAENKVFSITFRTLPANSRGVFHIIEHSVLNGSEKYPCKSLFSELLKGSLSTYLNAVTHSDRTTFTAASRNRQDFLNLMDVYLDGVFCPLVLRDERIFRQEGWRYEIEESRGLAYNGVVYNEMKGAFQSPDSRLLDGISALLYRDTSYRYVSGGDPAYIPDLSYEELKASHAKYYHPSNACVFLDGAMEIGEVLARLDAYFARYEKKQLYPLPVQPAGAYLEQTGYYPAADEEDGALLVLAQLLPGLEGAEKEAVSLLCGCLSGTGESPLVRRILEEGIAHDAYLSFDANNPVPVVMMTLRQADPARLQEAPGIVRAELARVLAEGVSQTAIEAEIDQLEYLLRDLDEPQGLYREDMVVRSWMYGEDPAEALDVGRLIGTLQAFARSGRFDELLGRIRFDGEGCAMYTMLPSGTKAQEEAAAEAARLADVLNSLDEAGRVKIAREMRELAAWQMQREDEAVLQTVPRLSVRDLGEPEKRFSTEERSVGGIRSLLHPADLVDIGYYALYFSLAGLTDEEILRLSLLTNVFTYLPTEGNSLLALDDRIKSVTGDLDFDVVTYADRTDRTLCRPYFRVRFGALRKNEADAFSLVKEILTKTRFTDETSLDLLRMILFQCEESLQNSVAEEGDRFALMRAASHLSAAGVMREMAEGVRFYEWISKTAGLDGQALASLAAEVAALAAKVFTPGRLTVSIAAKTPAESAEALAAVFGGKGGSPESSKNEDPAGTAGGDSAACRESEACEQVRIVPDRDTAPELILIPGATGYAARAGICSDFQATDYDGGRQVLAGVLDFEYLWKEVRVRGGAYGCGVYLSADGSAGFTSFRDPDPLHSLGVFGQAASFTESFFTYGRDIETYIVGAAGATDPLLHARDKAARADSDWFAGVTAEERALWRAQLLGADSDSLTAMAGYLTELTTCDCIIGGQELFSGPAPEGWKVTFL